MDDLDVAYPRLTHLGSVAARTLRQKCDFALSASSYDPLNFANDQRANIVRERKLLKVDVVSRSQTFGCL